MGTQIWQCPKKVKGHPKAKFVDLESQMLYTKIQLQSSLGSGEEDF